MEEKKPKRRVSLITDIILFLFFSIISFMIFKFVYVKPENNQEFSSNDLVKLERKKSDIEAENKMYVKKIKSKYGIKIQYGKDTEEFLGRINANVQKNIYVINNNLRIIYEALEKYPIDVFDMTKSKKYPITVMIVDSFNNDNLALASRNSLNEYKLYISNAEAFERAFHHEMYHLLEYYMNDTKKNLYANWNEFNPKGFKYEKDIKKLTSEFVAKNVNQTLSLENEEKNKFDSDVNSENPYFVSKYSKVTDKEDRAEIFAEMMILKRKPKFLENGQNIKKKADFMNEILKVNVSNNEFYYTKYVGK